MTLLVLSPRQRSELEHLASHESEAKVRCRALALLWLDEGETVDQVADSLRVGRRTVYYWWTDSRSVTALTSASGWPPLPGRAGPGQRMMASIP